MNKSIILIILLSVFNFKTVMAQVVDKRLTGFKDIEFEFSSQELEDFGFECAWVTCTLYQENVRGLTFLGQPVLSKKQSDKGLGYFGPELIVYLSDEESKTVSEIHIYVNLTGKEVARSLRLTLGSSIKWNDWEYWFFKNGAAVSTYNPDESFYPSKSVYHSKEQVVSTALSKIMPNELKPKLNASDF